MKRYKILLIVLAAVGLVAAAITGINQSNPSFHEQRCNDIRQSAFRAKNSGNPIEAERQYYSALAESKLSNNALQEAYVLQDMSTFYAEQHRLEDEEHSLRLVVQKYDQLKSAMRNDRSVRAAVRQAYEKAVVELAELLQTRDQNQAALTVYKTALSSNSEGVGSIDSEAQIKREYAALLKKVGRTSEAQQIETELNLDDDSIDWKELAWKDRNDYFAQSRWEQADHAFDVWMKRAVRVKDRHMQSLIYGWKGDCYIGEHKDEKAEQAFRDAAALPTIGTDDNVTFDILLACMLQHNGKKAEASACYKRAVASARNHEILLDGDVMINAFESVGRLNDALLLNEWLLDEATRTPGMSIKVVAMDWYRISDRYSKLGNYVKASEAAFKAKGLNAFPPTTADYSRILSRCAECLDRLGRLGEAEGYYKNALAVRVVAEATDARLEAWSGLWTNLDKQKKFDEAEKVLQERLDFCKKYQGPDHRNLAEAYGDFGKYYEGRNNLPKAEDYWRHAVDTMSKAPMKDAGYCDGLYSQLAKNQIHQGKFKEAAATLHEKLRYCNTTLGDSNNDSLTTLLELAFLALSQKRYDDHDKLCRQVLSTCESHGLTGNHIYVSALLQMGAFGHVPDGQRTAFLLKCLHLSKQIGDRAEGEQARKILAQIGRTEAQQSGVEDSNK